MHPLVLVTSVGHLNSNSVAHLLIKQEHSDVIQLIYTTVSSICCYQTIYIGSTQVKANLSIAPSNGFIMFSSSCRLPPESLTKTRPLSSSPQTLTFGLSRTCLRAGSSNSNPVRYSAEARVLCQSVFLDVTVLHFYLTHGTEAWYA